jgi:hypothetical protein
VKPKICPICKGTGVIIGKTGIPFDCKCVRKE